MKTTTFFPRTADLFDKIGHEYAAITRLLLRDPNARAVAARLSVLGDAAHAGQVAIENFRNGRHTQAMRRLAEAESAIADLPNLTAQHMQRQAESLSPLRAVDALLAGQVIAW